MVNADNSYRSTSLRARLSRKRREKWGTRLMGTRSPDVPDTTLGIGTRAGCDGCHVRLWKTVEKHALALDLFLPRYGTTKPCPSPTVNADRKPSLARRSHEVALGTKVSNKAVSRVTYRIRMALRAKTCSFPMSLDPTEPVPYVSSAPDNLEREESQLWRWALGFMLVLAVRAVGAAVGAAGEHPVSASRHSDRGAGSVDSVRGVRLRATARGQRTQRAAARVAGARGRSAFRRATRPAQPGHPALAAQLQGVDRFL